MISMSRLSSRLKKKKFSDYFNNLVLSKNHHFLTYLISFTKFTVEQCMQNENIGLNLYIYHVSYHVLTQSAQSSK